MTNLLIKGRTTLAIISGIISFGIIAQSISSRVPVDLAHANQSEIINNVSTSDSVQEVSVVEAETEKVPEPTVDQTKVNAIRNYLKKRNAPLADYAEEFVKAAQAYGIDYRIVASISVIESEGGKHCFKPYNAWGWGKSGFASWKEGIWAVSKGIGKYYSSGLNTPKLIAPRYCPPTASSWSRNVQHVMDVIGG